MKADRRRIRTVAARRRRKLGEKTTIAFKVTAAQRDVIAKAAELEAVSPGQFSRTAAYKDALRTIERGEVRP